ncbi:MAG: TlpA family protein disulfide reductase [bacterium]|nr:TlpA family protein disulfide reductase [bacterium]
MKPGRAILVLLLGCTVVIAGCSGEGDQPTPEETTLTVVGQVAPLFELETMDGELFSLEAQRGKVVLINFFATWCPPCREELPYLEKDVWQKLQDPRLAVLVVGREETEVEIVPFMEKNGFTFPVAGDPERVAYGKYASQYIPRNVVVGPDGTIVFQSDHFEKNEFDEMVRLIETTLAEMEPAAEG